MSPQRVPFLDLRRTAEFDGELEAAFARVLWSGCYILGPEVDAFEAACARYLGVRHAVGVSSGTDALLVSLMALGVGRADDVVCPAYSFFATAGAIARLGARPIFVDCEANGFNLDPEKLETSMTERTKAIVPVHLFGECANMVAIASIANERGVSIVEDAAQSFGAERAGRRAGTWGAFGCFSFFPSKNLGALGDAGLVVTNDSALAERVRVLRVQGGAPKYHHAVVGGNFRMDALQAALLRVRLSGLARATAERAANAAYYVEQLTRRGVGRFATTVSDAPVVLPRFAPGHVVNQFVIACARESERDRVRAFLRERGVETEIYYPVPLHLQECFASLGGKRGDFPVAEHWATRSLALPIFPGLSTDELDYVVASLADAVD